MCRLFLVAWLVMVVGLVIGHADTYLTLKSDPQKAMTAILAAAKGGQELIDRIDRAVRLGVGSERTLEQLNDVATEALGQARLLEAGATGVEWQAIWLPIYQRPTSTKPTSRKSSSICW